MHIQDVPVRGDEIRLGQFIKLANLVESGGTAKEVIAAGQVTVNGEVDTRRGRHLHVGDVVGLLDPDAGDSGVPAAAARVAAPVTGDDDDYFDEATADDDFDPEKWRNL
ncbi:RNA-binding S4 domain-containing protein [Corynebacterium terpenotabidum]|nr:RNA-binding S4 domain-containing protein [Corynebacterium terpenotabidum]